MPDLRDVLVFVHVASVLLFVLIHGASAVVAFRLSGERDPARAVVLLEASRAALNSWLLIVALLGFVASGIALGFMGSYWGRGWLWASIAVLVVIIIGMTPLAANRLRRARTAFGLEKPRGNEAAAAPDPEAGMRELEGWSPVPVATLGAVGLLAVLWLMMFKPF